MVERGDQAEPVREQHAVAEDVSGHVADPHGGELVALRVDAELGEVPAYGHPGTAGSHSELLVVEAGGPTRGERVAQPVAGVDGLLVRQVREGRGALVRGHHQIGVGTVRDDDAGRMGNAVQR